jgi:hypothetical protein
MLQPNAVYTEDEILTALSPSISIDEGEKKEEEAVDLFPDSPSSSAHLQAAVNSNSAHHAAAAQRLKTLVSSGHVVARKVQAGERSCMLYTTTVAFSADKLPLMSTVGETAEASSETPPKSREGLAAGTEAPRGAEFKGGEAAADPEEEASANAAAEKKAKTVSSQSSPSPSALPTSKRARMDGAHPQQATESSSGDQAARRKALLMRKGELETRRNKLRLVRTYRSSGDVADLDTLTEKWRSAAAEALEALAKAHPDATVPKLLSFYGIEADMVGYNMEDECFN